jgi:thiamine biosynthesis lipoprotein
VSGPRLFLLALSAILIACTRAEPTQRTTIAAFGSIVEITIHGSGHDQAQRAVSAVDREMQALHGRWHAWEPGPLARINRAIAAGRSIGLPESMAAPILEAKRLSAASEGLFNPAIGRLLALWGFHASELPTGPPPAAGTIAELVALTPSMADIEIRQGRLQSRNAAVQLDFGAYIKGYAVARAIELLEQAGIEQAVVNAGGDLGVIGSRGERPWRVGIRHPDGDGGQILARLALTDGEFAFTSGNYLRYREDEGIRYGHIIDPRSGYPAGHIASVTVIHGEGGAADAAATALAVAGADEWPRIAARLGVDKVLRVDAEGRVSMTPAMQERVQLIDSSAAVSLQSLPGD